MNDDRLAVFRKMLDPKRWPVKPDDLMVIQGEVYAWRTDDPLEECIYKPLYK